MVARLAPEFRGAQFGLALTAFRLPVLTRLVFCLNVFFPAYASELRPIEGPVKPAFNLPDLAGTNVALDSSRGRITFVHFFATWCVPCREEIPALHRLSERTKLGASIIAISVADNDQRLKQFFTQTPVSFPVLQDRDRAIAKAWDVNVLPTTYVLGVDQKPLFIVETDFPWDTINVDPVAERLTGSDQSEREITPSDNLSRRRGP